MEKITRVVLTGATGMIGATLVQVLLKEGAEVWALVRRSSARIRNLPKNEKLHLVDAELNHLDDLMEYMEGLPSKADAFFHLGWEGTYGSSRQDLYLQNRNVKNTLDAVHLANKLGCEVFVGAGSQAEYGKCSDKIAPDTPTFPETGYGIGKLCAEPKFVQAVRNSARMDENFKCLRTNGSGVYDGNVWDLPTAKRRTSSLYKGRAKMGLFVFRRCSKSIVFGRMQRKRSGNLLCWKWNRTPTV